jgi:hypothetical protein
MSAGIAGDYCRYLSRYLPRYTRYTRQRYVGVSMFQGYAETITLTRVLNFRSDATHIEGSCKAKTTASLGSNLPGPKASVFGPKYSV